MRIFDKLRLLLEQDESEIEKVRDLLRSHGYEKEDVRYAEKWSRDAGSIPTTSTIRTRSAMADSAGRHQAMTSTTYGSRGSKHSFKLVDIGGASMQWSYYKPTRTNFDRTDAFGRTSDELKKHLTKIHK